MTAELPVDNRSKLLVAARELLQTRGFNAFSFRDLAEIAQIKSSSVHYYFPTKEDLGVELIRGYTQELQDFLTLTEAVTKSPVERLRNFIQLFEKTAATHQKICLAGMLASDFVTLGNPLKAEVRLFFTVAEEWLTGQVGQITPAAATVADTQRTAQWIMASLEGALLTARVSGEPRRVRDTGTLIIQMLQERSRNDAI